MKKADLRRNHERFEKWIGWCQSILKTVTEAQRVIKEKAVKREIVEALLLKCAAQWEILVTQDIIASLNRDCSAYAAQLGLRFRKNLSFDECEAIFLGDRFRSFGRVSQLKSFARKHLVDKFNPFEAITSSMEKKIDEFIRIRNLLAHESSFAQRSYEQMMRDTYKYKNILDPGVFLLAINPATSFCRWNDYLKNFLSCSQAMKSRVP